MGGFRWFGTSIRGQTQCVGTVFGKCPTNFCGGTHCWVILKIMQQAWKWRTRPVQHSCLDVHI